MVAYADESSTGRTTNPTGRTSYDATTAAPTIFYCLSCRLMMPKEPIYICIYFKAWTRELLVSFFFLILRLVFFFIINDIVVIV
jgi:amino acid permease